MEAILNLRFAPGDRLPSLRDLGAHFHVSLITVRRAVQELQAEEWLVAMPRKGIRVADPLPPVAHLQRLKLRQRSVTQAAGARPCRRDFIGAGQNGVLTCLLFDEALLPLFEWAARTYAAAYAPCSLRFEVQPLWGRDDADSMRELSADLVLLPSYSISRAYQAGAITPAAGILHRAGERFQDLPPGLLDLVSRDGTLWGAPLMAGGPILTANEAACRDFGIDPGALTSIEALLAALEQAAERPAAAGGRLFNVTFLLFLVMLAGHHFPALAEGPVLFADPAVQALLQRLRALVQHPAITLTRFDQWDQVDLAALAVRHESSSLFCGTPAHLQGARVLPIPAPEAGGSILRAFCLAISARSVHPYEAWEWAAHLADAPFQTRLAKMGYDLPASLHPDVTRAFGQAVGAGNAAVLQGFLRRPSPLYGMGPEDVMAYSWEVLGHELYRFVSGQNDYPWMLERLQTKTDRFLRRAGSAPGGGARRESAPEPPEPATGHGHGTLRPGAGVSFHRRPQYSPTGNTA